MFYNACAVFKIMHSLCYYIFLDIWTQFSTTFRCVVSRGGEAVDMSIDHKPEDDEETARILKAGGKVTSDGRVNGGLNLSRAIGKFNSGKT